MQKVDKQNQQGWVLVNDRRKKYYSNNNIDFNFYKIKKEHFCMKKNISFIFIFVVIVVSCFACLHFYKQYKKQNIKSVILLGKPGCGKGTQAKIWVEKYDLYHIDAGQLLRNCVASNCKYKDEIKKAFESGTMVRNEITGFALKKEFEKNVYCLTCKYKGVIIDGCPRNMQNVKIFEDNDFKVKAVIDLNVSDEISKQRVLGRKSGRSDDNEEVLNRRLKVFNTDTLQVFEYFNDKGLYRQIDASGTTDEVLNNATKILNEVFNQ